MYLSCKLRVSLFKQQQGQRKRGSKVIWRVQNAVSVVGETDKYVQQWCRESGIKSDSLAVQEFQGLRGMGATEDIQEGDVLVELPKDLALRVSPSGRCPVPDIVDNDLWKRLPWYMKLAIIVVRELEKGEQNSKVFPYVSTLPRQVDTPFYWSASELENIAHEDLVTGVLTQRAQWQDWYSELNENPKFNISKEDLFWAASCARSRAFAGPFVPGSLKPRLLLAGILTLFGAINSLQGSAQFEQTLTAGLSVILFNLIYELLISRKAKQYLLCPVIDLINHKSGTPSTIDYNVVRETFSLAAGNSFSKDSQVYISYGNQTTDSLMQYYGFVEQQNVNDAHRIQKFFGKLQDKIVSSQFNSLLKNTVKLFDEEKIPTFVEVDRDGKVPPNVLQAVRYLIGDGKYELDQCSSKFDLSLEKQLWTTMVVVLREDVQKLKGNIKKLKGKMQGKRNRQELAKQYNEIKLKLMEGILQKWQQVEV
eukprot:TRINITY_DN25539_c0_g1_i5.p1 TRINITY_DN25539_c0_g1~~TRINITY_DN25539_c0_g1_i5.p1  ORF type:complete len:479 (-),score=65.53 TRINITY_DN25539_c0_g1_i5:126-1562(-)